MTLTAVDVSGAEEVPGAQVVRDGDLVAALHERPDLAEDALSRVEATFDGAEQELDVASAGQRAKE